MTASHAEHMPATRNALGLTGERERTDDQDGSSGGHQCRAHDPVTQRLHAHDALDGITHDVGYPQAARELVHAMYRVGGKNPHKQTKKKKKSDNTQDADYKRHN